MHFPKNPIREISVFRKGGERIGIESADYWNRIIYFTPFGHLIYLAHFTDW